MSKLEQLINKLCPNGVEYKAVKDVATITRGRVISKNYINNNQGNFPVYSSQTENNGELGYISTYDFDGEYLTWTTDGVNAGSVFYRTGKFSITNVCGLIKISDTNILTRFLYFVLYVEAKKYVNYGMGNPKLMSNVMAKIKVPVPPLPIQEDIVRILDKFTELSAELTAELTARKQQYAYYRNDLLSKNTNKKSLKQIALSSRSGGTPLKSNKDYYENGIIPWLRTQEVVFNEIDKTDCFITELAVQKTSAKWIPANCVIVAISGASAGRCAINKIPLTTNQHCLAIEINPDVALYKYVFYCVCNQYADLIAKKEGARGDLNSSRILSLEIPIPCPEDKKKSLAEQQRIVDILDRFDKLCNDINEGLPAEIKARQKQYEYYRDKLLTFKKKEA